MALHHRLSLWQKIVLGILCFPFLPIYLCVYCLCYKNEERKRTGDPVALKPNASKLFNTKVQTIIKKKGKTFLKPLYIPGKLSKPDRVYVIDENFEDQQSRKKTGSEVVSFTVKTEYPWDRSSLKSMEVDLKKFENLDSYASKLEPRGSLKQLTQQLLHNASTDLEKTRAIWMWICHHIEYDTKGYYDISQRFCDPDDVFRTRKGVCAGYSRLFKQMCSIAGVKCEEISGYSKGAGYVVGQKIPKETDHAWNMVYLEEGWHLLDSTWGAGHVDDNIDNFTFCYNEYYFLTHPALFIGDHYPEKKECQLLEPMVSKKHFEEHVCLKSWFYNNGLVSCHPETGMIETVKGKVSITIEAHHGTLFLFSLNGKKRNGVMKLLNCGMKLDVYPPETGQHRLQLFAKKQESEGNYHSALEYIIDCKSIDKNMKIPECLNNPAGPSWVTEASGLVEPSHPDPIIYTEDGCCSICFVLKKDLCFLCSLHSDEVNMTPEMGTKYIFIKQKEDTVEMKVRVPQSGTYVVKIFVKPGNSDNTSYDYLCNYLIICTNPKVKWPMFPLAYSNWAKNYELVQPLDGVLPNNINVSFKLHIPDVAEVCIDGEKNIPLTLSFDGYWEGNCSTTNKQTLKVMIRYKNQANLYHYILKYDVVS